MVRGDSLAHDTRCAGGGELAHVQPDLGDDAPGRPWRRCRGPRPGVPAPQRAAGRQPGWSVSWVPVVAAVVPAPVVRRRPWRLGGGDGGDQLLDAGGEPVDLDAEGVDLVQQHPRQLGVVVVEAAGQRLHQGGALAAHPPPGQLGQHLGVALPGDQRLQHGPPGDAHDVGGHRGQLDQGVLQQLLQPLHVPGAVGGQVGPQPGVVPQPADLGGWDERGSQHAPLVELGQPHRIQLVGLGAARQVLDVAGVDQPHHQPAGLQQVHERPPVVGGGLHHDAFDALGRPAARPAR